MRQSLNSKKSHFLPFRKQSTFYPFHTEKKYSYNKIAQIISVWIMCLEQLYFIFMPIRVRILTRQFLHILIRSRLDSALHQSFSLFQVKRNFSPQTKPLDPQDFPICTITSTFRFLASFFSTVTELP